jgi:hypothetical protein
LLDDAVAAWLDSVSERASYEPLLALLRARGYSDAHLAHGQREFGKDIVAKRDAAQWAFQVKAGDIGQGEWRELDGQLNELRVVDLGHSSFDPTLPRRPVLVTTGRLVGNSSDLFREHNRRARERDEPELTLWDRDTLIGYLSGEPEAVLRGSIDAALLATLGAVEERKATAASIEDFSQRWTEWDIDHVSGAGVIEAALICERLKNIERIDLACHMALCLVRAAWAARGGENRTALADAAGHLFETYALQLWNECDERLLREKGLVGFSGASAWITYPIRCCRIAELLGLLAIRLRPTDDQLASDIGQWLVRFAHAQPGVAHPVSDAYAVSLIPAALTLAASDRNAAIDLLRDTTVWLTNASQPEQFGLAGADARPSEEIERLIGNALDSIDYPRRPMSLIATVLLDLCAALGAGDLYADAHNDIRACEIAPMIIRLDDGRDQYLRAGEANRLELNIDYADVLRDGKLAAAHHADAAGSELCDKHRAWDLLAISSALRDRHHYRAIAAVVATCD